MIKGFEKETTHLTEDELAIAKIVAAGLARRTKSNPASSTEICNKMNEAYPDMKLTDVRLRRIINHLRLNGMPNICASSSGYYCGTTKDVQEYIIGLRQRISAQEAIYKAAVYFIEKNIKK